MALLGLIGVVLCGGAAAQMTVSQEPTVTPVTFEARKNPQTHRVGIVYMRTGYEGADKPFTLVEPRFLSLTDIDPFVATYARQDTYVLICEFVWKDGFAHVDRYTCPKREAPQP
jgi:hypothetical protein